jgi:hypothetical protein
MIAGLSFALRIGLCLLFLALSPVVKLSSANSPPQKRVISGQDTPQEIPSFVAWRFFIIAIVTASDRSYIDTYVDETMNLARFWHEQPALRQNVIALLVDEVTQAQHRIKELDNESYLLNQGQQKGILKLTEDAFEQQQLELERNQVKHLTKTCDAIRDALIKLDAQKGPEIWDAIIDFVDTHVKGGTAVSTDDKPTDRALFEIWNTFNPSKLNKAQSDKK